MEKRLFLAIDLPFDLKQLLVGQQKIIERHNKKIKLIARWTPVENLHITVLFLGRVLASRIDELKHNLEAELAEASVIEFELFKIDLAPPHSQPARMVWAYFESDKHYLSAVEKVRAAASGFILKEVRKASKPPLAHVTLARFKQPIKAQRLTVPELPVYGWRAKEIALWESRLGGGQVVYRQIASFKLKV